MNFYIVHLLVNNYSDFLNKSGAVRSVDWIFIIGVPACRWLGAKRDIGQSVSKSGSSPTYCHIFLFIAFLREAFVRKIIIVLCITYIMLVFTDNNSVTNNNLWKTPWPYFACQNSHGHAKDLLRNL